MKRSLALVVVAMLCGFGPSQAGEDGFEQILSQQDGRYTKHGWNHYGPGHFELDPETGVLTSRGGMGLFWYAVKEYGDFVLELEFNCEDDRTNSGVFLRVPGVPTFSQYEATPVPGVQLKVTVELVRVEPGAGSVILAEGVSSLTMVPVPVALPMGAPEAALRFTEKVSSGSLSRSPRTATVTVSAVWPGAKLRLPPVAV